MVQELAFGLPVPDDLVEMVCARCMVIAHAHQNDRYSHELEHAVEVTIHLARRLDSPLRAPVVRRCLALAMGLHPFTLARLLEWLPADLAGAENYPEAIMRALSSPEYVFNPNSRDEVLLRSLRDSAPTLNEVQRASVASTSAAYRTCTAKRTCS